MNLDQNEKCIQLNSVFHENLQLKFDQNTFKPRNAMVSLETKS